MEAVETAIKLKPDLANAYNNRGMIFCNTKRYKESIASFRQAIALNPELAAAHNNLGTALAMTGKVKDSLNSYMEAIRLKPDWDYALYNLAVSYLKLGQREEARKPFDSLKTINPELAAEFAKQFYQGFVVDAPKPA